jgi:PAS domain S-box-containing protein
VLHARGVGSIARVESNGGNPGTMPFQEGLLELFDLRPLAKNTRSRLDAPIHLVFFLLILLVGVGGWLAWRHTGLLYQYQAQVSQSHRVLTQYQLLLITAVDAETAVRGYLATGQESYLAPYREAAGVIEARVAELRDLAPQAGHSADSVDHLAARSDTYFATLERMLATALSGDDQAALQSLRTGEARRLMDGIRGAIGQATLAEQSRLAALESLARKSSHTAEVTVLLIAVAGVFLLIVLYNLILRFGRLRARTSLAIEDARERFEVALGSIGDAVIVTDSEGRLAYCNEGCRTMLLIREEHLGRPLEELIHSIAEGSNGIYDSLVRRAMGEPGIQRTSADTEIRLSDGRRLLVDASAARLEGEGGQSRGVVLVLRDVTERRERDRELARSHERFRSLVLATSQIVWTTDPQGRVREDSPSWRAYTGQTYEQWCGLGWLDALHPEDRQRTLEDWQDAVAEQRPFACEYRLRRVDGSYCWNLVRSVPVKDSDGTVREWVGMNHDIEEIKRAETARREASRRKDEFIALLAHELRNPLAPLRNGLALLNAGSGAETSRAIEMMDRQVAHIVRLIDDLLDVSRIRQGKFELRQEDLDLRVVLSESVESVLPLAAGKQQELIVSVPDDPLWTHGDPARLLQVFTNLLNNAVKYSGRGATIWMTAEREGAQILVSVRDTGQGIAPEFRPRIWDLFLQGNGQIERSEGGLGIGLTLVKQLVEMHGGQVDVDSAGLGLGSEFSVRLASVRWAQALESREPPAAPAPPQAVRPVRILVIDDNEDSVESTAMLLRLNGHSVRTASRGEEGIAEFARFAPEIVLCDIRMPDLTGFEVARRLRAEFAEQTFVMVAMTGFGSRMDREASREAGFDRHLVKPMDPSELSELIREAAALTERATRDARA